MTKVELIASVAAEAGMSKKDAEKAVNAALAAITEELKNGGEALEAVARIGREVEVARTASHRLGEPERGFDIDVLGVI